MDDNLWQTYFQKTIGENSEYWGTFDCVAAIQVAKKRKRNYLLSRLVIDWIIIDICKELEAKNYEEFKEIVEKKYYTDKKKFNLFALYDMAVEGFGHINNIHFGKVTYLIEKDILKCAKEYYHYILAGGDGKFWEWCI